MPGFFHLLDWLYPVTCELCGQESELALCPDCLSRQTRLPRPICLYCGCPVSGGQSDPFRCPECAGKPRTFSFARHAFMRTDELMGLLYRFKYHHANYLAPAFAAALAELWQETPEFRQAQDWALVPVPTTRQHLRQRGYNQSEELALCLGKILKIPVLCPLERHKTGAPSQTLLRAGERLRNAFAALHPAQCYSQGKRKLPSHLVVIDDLYTTGATARACARALYTLDGVETVGVLTLLYASLQRSPHQKGRD